MVALESLYFPWWQLRGDPPGYGRICNPYISTVSYAHCSLGLAVFLVSLLSSWAHTVFDAIQKQILSHRPHLQQTYLLTDDYHKLGLKPIYCFLWVTFTKLHYKIGIKCYQWIVIAYGLFFPAPPIVILPTHTHSNATHTHKQTHMHICKHTHTQHTHLISIMAYISGLYLIKSMYFFFPENSWRYDT